MPGRDDLVQQNIARARANSQAPQPQERDGKSSSSGGLGAPRSFLGGNFEVYSALERVEFQGSLGDASLRGNTAYIRLWKRGNTSQQTSASAQASDVSDSQAELQEELEAAIDNRDAVANNFDPVTGTYGYNPYGDVDNPIEVAEANVQIAESKIDLERKKALSSQTPVSSQSASPTTTAVAQTSQGRTTTTPAGSVKSANPNGFLSTLGRVGRAAIGIAGGRAVYSGGAMGSTEASAPSGEMMWQFLFNPSELELEVGPEFKNAETWGVSEKGNSGQPLHWSHNKNALLKFNSVLLNGFVFGRKVEALEQGLVELFMARDGEGQHGPHVLEFVWGKRVFGPCVIKNINIKEKMWDEGEVVNAEVSFTLEQVPEWTINDGFVDVARPGRLGTIGDPAIAGSSAASPAGAGPAGENQPPRGRPDQKPPSQAGLTSSELYRKCQRAGVYAEQFWQIESDGRLRYRDGTISLRTSYSTLYPQAVNELGSSFTSLIKEPLTNPTFLYKSTQLAIDAEDNKAISLFKDYSKAGNFVKRAANSARLAAKGFSDSSQCRAERDRVNKVTQQQKQQASCNSKRLGSSCSEAGIGEGQTTKTCSGILLQCARGYLRDPNSIKL